ncbi:MAG: hypothetical protein ABR582_11130 [Gemmatimonadaceae bacterium]
MRLLTLFAFLGFGVFACSHGAPDNEPIPDIRAIAGNDTLSGMLVLLDGKRVTGGTRLNIVRAEIGLISNFRLVVRRFTSRTKSTFLNRYHRQRAELTAPDSWCKS